MTMSTCFGGQQSTSISRSDYLSSLPLWRRWLSMLNWHPVVEYEVREIEFKNRKIEHKKRMQQLQSETEQLKKENARLAASNARLERFEREHWSGLTPHPSTGDSWSS